MLTEYMKIWALFWKVTYWSAVTVYQTAYLTQNIQFTQDDLVGNLTRKFKKKLNSYTEVVPLEFHNTKTYRFLPKLPSVYSIENLMTMFKQAQVVGQDALGCRFLSFHYIARRWIHGGRLQNLQLWKQIERRKFPTDKTVITCCDIIKHKTSI